MIMFIFVLFVFFNLRSSYYEPKWYFSTLAASAILSYLIYIQTNLAFGLLIQYILASTIYLALWCRTSGGPLKNGHLYVQSICAKSLISCFSMVVVFLFLDQNIISQIKYAIPFILIGNLIFKMLPEKFRKSTDYNGNPQIINGMGGNVSVDSTLISIMVAIMLAGQEFGRIEFVALMASCLSFMINKASAGVLAFSLSFLIFLVFKIHFIEGAACFVSACVVIGFHYRKILLCPSGRVEIWKFIYSMIIVKMNKITGIGNGRFKYVMPMLEEQNMATRKYSEPKFKMIFAHNDIVQFFVEGGIIGMLLLIWFLATIIPNFGVNEWIIFSTVFVNAFFNFPFHLAPDTFLILMSLKEFFINDRLHHP